MSTPWKLFKFVCFVQMLATVYFTITSLISLFQSGDIYYLFETMAFGLMSALSILALNILSSNYPDKAIVGRQKRIFNWLFLLNFLLIAFLFGLFFAEYGQLKSFSRLFGRSIFILPVRLLLPLIAVVTLLIFQFVILYGLYELRRLLFKNFFVNKKFEFES